MSISFSRRIQYAVDFPAHQNIHNSCKLPVETSRHQLPDCHPSTTTRDLWHLVCIQRSTPVSTHPIKLCISWIYLSNPVLIDTLWTGWGGRRRNVNARQQLYLISNKSWKTAGIVSVCSLLIGGPKKEWSPQSRKKRGKKENVITNRKQSDPCILYVMDG